MSEARHTIGAVTSNETNPALSETPTLDGVSAEHEAFAAAWTRWHDAHEARRADPHGFLAITSITWLYDEPQEIDGIPGRWLAEGDRPVVELAPGESLEVGGETVGGRHEFGPVDEAGIIARSGDVDIEIALRGDTVIVRPRDPRAPYLATYPGTPAYLPDPKFAVQARFEAYDEPRDVTIGSVVEGLESVDRSPGELAFTVGGVPQRLVAFNGATPGSLRVLFTDVTSGVTTYAATRTLDVPAPAADGSVVVDFNRATNLPCAYTDFATCPLPPASNHLSVAIEAGEKMPLSRV